MIVELISFIGILLGIFSIYVIVYTIFAIHETHNLVKKLAGKQKRFRHKGKNRKKGG